MIKNDFPLFNNNPGIVYLDSAATVQKPAVVIDGLKRYLENDYANIHRGTYELSERSEELFWSGRKTVAEWMEVVPEEVVFTGNSTDASNLLVQSMIASGMVQKDDVIMLGEGEHHANIVPRQMACERVGCRIVWIPLLENGAIDRQFIAQTIDATVRVVSITAVSNVTGTITPIKEIAALIPDGTYFVIDASQAVPHMSVLPNDLGCDFCRWTGHKIGALPGIGVLRGKKGLLKTMTSARGGGGAIESVTKEGYSLLGSPDKFEPGTPNLTGALSVKLAVEYLKELAGGGLFEDFVDGVERPLVNYCLEQFSLLEEKGIVLLGSKQADERVGVFSFLLPEGISSNELGRVMAQENICVRCGGQCAHIFHEGIGKQGSCRMSLWVYNDLSDCEKFFKVLNNLVS